VTENDHDMGSLFLSNSRIIFVKRHVEDPVQRIYELFYLFLALLFLPTYSLHLNPIEHCWHTVKSILRPLVQNGYDNFQNLIGDIVPNI
jgi:transposase